MHEPSSRPVPDPASQGPTASNLTRWADGLVMWIARHWLALFNTALGIYLLLPILAPMLMQAHIVVPARVIYGLYSFTCHQLPDHSYFLFSDFPTPDLAALEANGMPPGLSLLRQRRYIGDKAFGYKVALCQRDVAIYASVLFSGLLFGLLRRRLRAPNLKIYALFLVPIAIDGLSQMVGLRESNWWLRTITGALFGVASVWLVYPYVERAMGEVEEGQQSRLRAYDAGHGPGINRDQNSTK